MPGNIPTPMRLRLVDPERKCDWVYDPKEDVTPYEVALLLNLMFYLNVSRSVTVSGVSHFIETNGLQRHFERREHK